MWRSKGWIGDVAVRGVAVRGVALVSVLCLVVLPGCDSDDGTGGNGEAAKVTDNFGDACSTTADCAAGPADYCVAKPGQKGFCSTTGCVAGGCPTDHKCCDCTTNSFGQTMPVFCADTGPTFDMMSTTGGCACEP